MDTITTEKFLALLKGSLSQGGPDFPELKEALLALEQEWTNREGQICELKDQELVSLESQLKEAHRREQFINEIGRQLTGTLELDAIITVFHRAIASRVPVDRILLAFYNQKDDSLNYRVFEEEERSSVIPETVYLSTVHRMVVQTVQKGRIMIFNSLPEDADEFMVQAGGSVLLSPLRIEGCVRGVLLLQTDREEGYQEEHSLFLQSLSPFLATAVFNARSHERVAFLNQELEREKQELISAYAKITKMANYDSLTDLPNLRLLNEFLPRYMEQAKRQGWSLAVFFIDLDNFKPVNDTFGHETGDRLLTEAADRIRRSIRRSDVAARVGGDEFIALVQGIQGDEGVERSARKILQELATPFFLGDVQCRIGASIGISLYPGDGVTPEELKNNADKAMYYVKGQNKAGFAFYGNVAGEIL